MSYEEILKELEAGNSLKNICEVNDLKYHPLYKKIKKDFPHLLNRKKSNLVKNRYKKAQEIPLNVDEVVRLYTIEKISAREIANRMNVVQNVILKRLRDLGIPKNNQSEYWTDDRRKHQSKLCHDGVIGIHNPNNKYRYTGIEQRFAAWLDNNGISFERQKQLTKGHHRYDFYLNGTNILVEIDGAYWHNKKSQQIKDKKFIDEAEKLGYNVIRFSDTEINETKDICFERIYEWI